jgi:hypothetical protein
LWLNFFAVTKTKEWGHKEYSPRRRIRRRRKEERRRGKTRILSLIPLFTFAVFMVFGAINEAWFVVFLVWVLPAAITVQAAGEAVIMYGHCFLEHGNPLMGV